VEGQNCERCKKKMGEGESARAEQALVGSGAKILNNWHYFRGRVNGLLGEGTVAHHPLKKERVQLLQPDNKVTAGGRWVKRNIYHYEFNVSSTSQIPA